MLATAAALKPHEVLVAVKAVGINFRDVLNVLGMYPGDPGPPGSDCAGIVMHAGASSGFQPGDDSVPLLQAAAAALAIATSVACCR